jgi:vacuolar-type H+-ATPase subunit F/Vma7
MVVVEEELMAGLEEGERASFSAVVVPLIIEVAGELAWKEAAEGPTEDYVARLIRRAVGYQLNIKL